LIQEYNFELEGVLVIDPMEEKGTERFEMFVQHLYKKRQRRGITLYDARKFMTNRNYFAASMVEFGEADTLISGLTKNYASTIKPALQVIGAKEGTTRSEEHTSELQSR